MKVLPETPQEVVLNPIKGEPITTGETGTEILSVPFIVTTEGCTVRFGIEQTYYHLAVTLPNYNALYSLLLACWLNQYRVRLTYRLPIRPPHAPPPDPNDPITLSIVSAEATFVK